MQMVLCQPLKKINEFKLKTPRTLETYDDSSEYKFIFFYLIFQY